ncbi:hypothetical protein V1511DRAFT_473893 [Dipodascopsis uninucleata]
MRTFLNVANTLEVVFQYLLGNTLSLLFTLFSATRVPVNTVDIQAIIIFLVRYHSCFYNFDEQI